jgi:hypothetical protein
MVFAWIILVAGGVTRTLGALENLEPINVYIQIMMRVSNIRNILSGPNKELKNTCYVIVNNEM